MKYKNVDMDVMCSTGQRRRCVCEREREKKGWVWGDCLWIADNEWWKLSRGYRPWALLQGLGNTPVSHALWDASLGGHRSEWVLSSPGYTEGPRGASPGSGCSRAGLAGISIRDTRGRKQSAHIPLCSSILIQHSGKMNEERKMAHYVGIVHTCWETEWLDFMNCSL